jgi:hypothetical protein
MIWSVAPVSAPLEGLEWRTRLDADHDRRTSDHSMLRGIGVHREETFGWGRQDDRLGNDGSHGALASSLESGDTGQCRPSGGQWAA